MQNKAKVKYAKINVSSFVTSKYVQVGQLVIQTNKANSKPIKAKTNPIQTQFNPIKAKTKPICRKPKNERSCVENELYDCFNNITRGFYHPNGCQFYFFIVAKPAERALYSENTEYLIIF